MARAIEHGPGLVRIGRPERPSSAAAQRLRALRLAENVAEHAGRPSVPRAPRVRAQVVRSGWSARSRRRMLQAFLSLDLTPLLRSDGELSMITLTLPGAWEHLAPTGADWAAMLRRFFARLDRAWPDYGACLVKTEFQRRGAPHAHILMSAPPGQATFGRGRATQELTFVPWVSATWATVVGATGQDRVHHELAGTQVRAWSGSPAGAVAYFAKYVSKSGNGRDRQDQPPDLWKRPGAGLARVWSHRSLERAVVSRVLSKTQALWAQRILRRYMESQNQRYRFRVQRGLRRRYVTRPVRRLRRAAGGWVAVPNGPSLAAQVERAAALAAAARGSNAGAAELPR